MSWLRFESSILFYLHRRLIILMFKKIEHLLSGDEQNSGELT